MGKLYFYNNSEEGSVVLRGGSQVGSVCREATVLGRSGSTRSFDNTSSQLLLNRRRMCFRVAQQSAALRDAAAVTCRGMLSCCIFRDREGVN